MLAVYLLNEIIKGFPFSKARDSCPFLSRFCWWIIRRALLSIDRMLLRGVLKSWTSFRFILPYGPFAGKSLVIVVIRHLLITHARVTREQKDFTSCVKNIFNKEEITLISWNTLWYSECYDMLNQLKTICLTVQGDLVLFTNCCTRAYYQSNLHLSWDINYRYATEDIVVLTYSIPECLAWEAS